MQWAVGLGHAEMVQALIDHGVEPEADDLCSAMQSHRKDLVAPIQSTG